jgi:hypothetical protein
MEQSIFITIVKMANEMDYEDKCHENLERAQVFLEGFIPHVRTTLKTGILRNMASAYSGKDNYSDVFMWRGRPIRFAIYMEYRQYIDAGKIREEGIMTLTPQKHNKNLRGYYDTKGVYARRVYRTMEEFQEKLTDIIHGVRCMMWGSL